ncbi:MAG: Ig-like domain-containing protein [Oscillospiraceae bacterium]|nr:Ig-like domain-containing protein [Oscillospiraceae bacterium]
MIKNNFFKRTLALIMSVCMISGYASFAAYAEDDESDDIVEILATDEEMSAEGEAEFSEVSDNNEDTDDTENSPSASADDDSAVAGGGNEDVKEVTVPARNIRLLSSQTNDLVIGDTFQIKFSLSPLKSDDYVTYKSYDKRVVKVDENGLVTAIGYGSTRIQVRTSSGAKKNIYFNVTDAEGNEDAEYVQGEVSSIELLSKNAMVHVGKKVQIEPIIYPLGFTDELTYKSHDTSVAKVSSSGVVTATGSGSTTITVTASNGVSAEFNITVYSDVYRGIDVSKWQGNIDWKKVAANGIDFAMIRSSFGNEHVDEKLQANVDGCEKYGISYGFYHYTYATTAEEARVEARFFLNTIKNYNPDYPVVLDIEEEFYKKMSRKQVTNIIVAFASEVEKAGYYVSVYSYAKFFNDYVDMSKISKYNIWVASWGDEEKLNSVYDGHYDMWQYSSTGKISGIAGEVDLDYSYKDYSEIIRRNGLNKF